MANTRSLMNKVLVGLRQEPVATASASTTDEYHLLVLQMVNEAKEEVEESWDWNALRHTVTVSVSAGTTEYVLSTAGAADIDVPDNSRFLYEKAAGGATGEHSGRGFGAAPQCFDVTTSTEKRLIQFSREQMERYELTDNDETGEPRYFALWQSGGYMNMKVWPIPDASYTVKLRFLIPQTELTSSSLDTTLTVPARPVWTRALFKANEERGSELGRHGSSLWMASMDALAAAIAREQSEADITSYPM
jgi:hypothetical protein